MRLSNDTARCADALDRNCQWRDHCARWLYRLPRSLDPPREQEMVVTVWSNFAAAVEPGTKCQHIIKV